MIATALSKMDWRAYAVLGAVLVVMYLLIRRDAKDAIGAVVDPITGAAKAVGGAIANPDNPVAATSNAALRWGTGNNVDTVGTWFFGLTHGNLDDLVNAPVKVRSGGGG